MRLGIRQLVLASRSYHSPFHRASSYQTSLGKVLAHFSIRSAHSTSPPQHHNTVTKCFVRPSAKALSLSSAILSLLVPYPRLQFEWPATKVLLEGLDLVEQRRGKKLPIMPMHYQKSMTMHVLIYYSDAFSKREKAGEDMYVREQEMQK